MLLVTVLDEHNVLLLPSCLTQVGGKKVHPTAAVVGHSSPVGSCTRGRLTCAHAPLSPSAVSCTVQTTRLSSLSSLPLNLAHNLWNLKVPAEVLSS